MLNSYFPKPILFLLVEDSSLLLLFYNMKAGMY